MLEGSWVKKKLPVQTLKIDILKRKKGEKNEKLFWLAAHTALQLEVISVSSLESEMYLFATKASFHCNVATDW